MNVMMTPARPAKLQFGIYRDGDNNLDEIQSPVIAQAFAVSARDPGIAVDVADYTERADFASGGGRRTESYDVRDGAIEGTVRETREGDPASRAQLSKFVAHTLDEAERNGATQTWVDLVDHGGGDAGGLESAAHNQLMRSDDIAGAIADGIALHAKEHPEDAQRRVDGVVSNQCLMATLGFASALSHAGVRYLAASPETMLAPGVPTGVAEDIASHEDAPAAMSAAIVRDTMQARYHLDGDTYAPAAAFDVLDCDPAKIASMEHAVAALDATIARDAVKPDVAASVLADARAIDGMVRFTADPMPYKSDRPAKALYGAFASDGRLPDDLRNAARQATNAVDALVLAHRESRGFGPFDGASYSDAAGPTVHFAVNALERDPWAPKISETDTAFYAKVGAANVDRALGVA